VNLDWVIPCRYLEVHDNLGTIIGAGIDTYWLPELPQTITVVLAVRLLATADELDENVQHHTINRVRDPSGELVSEVGGEFAMGGGESARPGWLTGMILPSLVQIEVTEEGTYTIEHELDGSSKSLPIHVVHGLPTGVDHADEV
jgi:uncharacterized protein DUF6941